MEKKLLISFFLLTKIFFCSAQTSLNTNGILFQAIATDQTGKPVIQKNIFIRDNILFNGINGQNIYSEMFSVKTSSEGVFTIIIGKGTPESGNSFDSIDWSIGRYFLNIKIAIPPINANNSWIPNNSDFIDIGTSQFWSVPYAFYANNVKGLNSKLSFSDTTQMLNPYLKKIELSGFLDSLLISGNKTTIDTSTGFYINYDTLKNKNNGVEFQTSDNANYRIFNTDTVYNGVTDNFFNLGYNYLPTIQYVKKYYEKPSLKLQMENTYNHNSQNLTEFNLDYIPPYSNNFYRYLYLQIDQATNLGTWEFGSNNFIIYNDKVGSNNINFKILNGDSLVSYKPTNVLSSPQITSLSINPINNIGRLNFSNNNITKWDINYRPDDMDKLKIYNSQQTEVSQFDQNGNFTAKTLRVYNGYSNSFLKADGSLDSSIYLSKNLADSIYLRKQGDTITNTLLFNSENSPPIIFQNINLTNTPMIGAIEFDGRNLYFTDTSGKRNTIAIKITETTDEFIVDDSNLNTFQLNHIPALNTNVKMYINGLRVSINNYTVNNNIVTYTNNPALNLNDRVSFDYSY
jgi:hypothetical protein